MSAPGIRNINCTSCGAGLSVLGGGRVRTQVCEYCGSVLDAQENFAVLSKFGNLPRPATPFQIGMTGQIDGVEWTVIGLLGMTERFGGDEWHWVDHQLFSPTHGYCWLTVENGHFIFTRKVRGPGAQGWFGAVRVESAESQPKTMRNGQSFTYYESGRQEISYAEGSFNWIPKRGETANYTSFLGDGEMLTQVFGATEKEVELSRYLNRDEVASAFGLADTPEPVGVHPLQPIIPWAHGTFVRNMGFLAGAIGLVIWLMQLASGSTVLDLPPQSARNGIEAEFVLTDTRNLTDLRFESDARNSWAWYDIELIGPSGDTVAEFGRQAEYYSGRSGGESWSEGSGKANARLRLREAGTYKLLVEQTEAGTWGGGSEPRNVAIQVVQGKKTAFWMLIASLICAMAGLVVTVRRMMQRSQRWSGSDWSDDD